MYEVMERLYTPEEFEAMFPSGESRTVLGTTGKWPIVSRALGVHPSEVQIAREHAARSGVPTEFTSDGRAIITSQKHQNRYAKTRGLINNDRYY